MAQYTYEDYEVQESQRNVNQGGTRVSYFALADDGHEAVVRFNYSNVKDIQIEGVHAVRVDDKMRRISCLRNPYEPLHACPLCEAGERVYSKFYVQLLEYVRTDDGKVVAIPKIWERPATFAKTIKSYLEEYGDLKDVVFKVKRHGKKGSTDTTYNVMFCNPNIYKEDVYVKDFAAFDTYSLRPYVVMDKTFDEMVAMVNGTPMPAPAQAAPVQQAYANNAASYNQAPVEQPMNPVYGQAPAPTYQAETATPYQAPYRTPQHQEMTANTSADPSASRPRRYTY